MEDKVTYVIDKDEINQQKMHLTITNRRPQWGAVGLIRDDERRDKPSGKYQRSKADVATLPP